MESGKNSSDNLTDTVRAECLQATGGPGNPSHANRKVVSDRMISVKVLPALFPQLLLSIQNKIWNISVIKAFNYIPRVFP